MSDEALRAKTDEFRERMRQARMAIDTIAYIRDSLGDNLQPDEAREG